MSSIPLRARITVLVVAFATTIVLLIVGLGGVQSVDSELAIDSFESTSEALAVADNDLATYGTELRTRIQEWADSGDSPNSFDNWEENTPGLVVRVVDEQGQMSRLDVEGDISLSNTTMCTGSPGSVTCDADDRGPEIITWAQRNVEARTNVVSEKRPVVVHGFVVTDQSGNELLVRYEADVFATSTVEVTSGFEDLALIALPVLLIALGAITWLALGRALSPVAAMIDQVDNIGADSLHQRVEVPAAEDELKRLATTMNQMLDRLQGASERQRQFISDASHELRSPITATGATLEVARTNPDDADWEHVAAVVDEENGRLASLVDDLLVLARMDEHASRDGQGWTVDLEEICLAEADRPHHVEVAVRVIEPVRVTGNGAMLTRAIRNLVDNAAAHAATSVQIEVGHRGSEAIVRVHDDGPGVPPEFADKIFERFVRVDESRARGGSGGAGLGLAIARSVAQNHGGRLELVRGSENGATFELGLPRS